MGLFHLGLLISSMLFLTLMWATVVAHAHRRRGSQPEHVRTRDR